MRNRSKTKRKSVKASNEHNFKLAMFEVVKQVSEKDLFSPRHQVVKEGKQKNICAISWQKKIYSA